MGSNYEGLFGFLLFVVGVAVGGLTIVALATQNWAYFIAGAIIGVAGIAGGLLLWINVSRREHHDPLEPAMTAEGIRRYTLRRKTGTC